MREADAVAALSKHLDDQDNRFFIDSKYDSFDPHELCEQFDNCGINNTIRIGRRIPDVIGYNDDGEIFAVEVKGDKDIRKGIGQAAHYRQGVHKSFLAADRSALSEFEDTIFSCGIGMFSITESENGSHEIVQREPIENVGATELNKTRRALAIKTSDFQSDRSAFSSSTMPLNAFLPVVMIATEGLDASTKKEETENAIVDHEHGLGRSTSAHTFSLARTLQLIQIDGRTPTEIRLTDVGQTGYYVLKGKVESFNEWRYGIDQGAVPDNTEDRIIAYLSELKQRSQYRSQRVYENDAEIAAFLRDRYLTIPDVRLLTRVLSSHPGNRVEVSRILSEVAMDTPDVFLNLFVDSRREKDFQSLMDSSTIDPENERIQKEILEIASPDYLYNFVSQLIHVRILNSESDPVHQEDEFERGTHFWQWDEDIIGDLGFQATW